jgi:hypothetical protein
MIETGDLQPYVKTEHDLTAAIRALSHNSSLTISAICSVLTSLSFSSLGLSSVPSIDCGRGARLPDNIGLSLLPSSGATHCGQYLCLFREAPFGRSILLVTPERPRSYYSRPDTIPSISRPHVYHLSAINSEANTTRAHRQVTCPSRANQLSKSATNKAPSWTIPSLPFRKPQPSNTFSYHNSDQHHEFPVSCSDPSRELSNKPRTIRCSRCGTNKGLNQYANADIQSYRARRQASAGAGPDQVQTPVCQGCTPKKSTMPQGHQHCSMCKMTKHKDRFSNKQLQEYDARQRSSRHRRQDPEAVPGPRCRDCQGEPPDEFECYGCHKTLSRGKYTKAQLKQKDKRVSIPCSSKSKQY